jgi:pimeloyl-ACP methyl ester carboxylesterase
VSEPTLETTLHDEHVEGRQYRVHASGTTDAGSATVLLVHGIGMTHASLYPVQQALPPGIRCLNVDLAGFGSTEHPGDAVAIERYAADLAEIMDRLDAWPIVAAGHSMGSQVVLELARLRPEGVRTVVMVGPVVDDARRTVPRQAADLTRDTFGEPLSVNTLVLRDYVRGGIRWYVAVLRQMMRYPTLERMRGCTVPVVVVRGRHDPIARRDWCVRLVGAAPGAASLLTVEGDHHVVPRTSPGCLAAELAALAGGSDVGGS